MQSLMKDGGGLCVCVYVYVVIRLVMINDKTGINEKRKNRKKEININVYQGCEEANLISGRPNKRGQSTERSL